MLAGYAGQIFGDGIKQLNGGHAAVNVHPIHIAAGNYSSDKQAVRRLVAVFGHYVRHPA